MEQYHSSQQMTDRLYCENESCSDPRAQYCSYCDQVLCADCSAGFHQKCKPSKIPDAKDVADCLDITKSVLSSIRQDSKHFKTSSSTYNFDEELKKFNEMLSIINEKFTNSIKNSNFNEFCSIMKNVAQLQKEITESGLITHSSKSTEFELALSREHLSSRMAAESQGKASEVTLIGYQRESNGEDLDRLISKCGDETTEHKTENVFEKTIFKEDTQNTLEHLYVPIHNVRDNEQIDKSKSEKQKHVISDTTWKDIKQRELKILEQERKIQEAVFSRIYKRRIIEKKPIIPSFYLLISLKDVNQKSLTKDYLNSKLRLPDLQVIQINYISDADANLARFLIGCIPARLESLSINWNAINITGIKSKFYVDAFAEAARKTTNEVYFHCIDFSAEDLQTVVRAACNTERIVFSLCCIHCSSGLDFGADLSYKTKFLSFQWCGSVNKERTTDWKADPSSFSMVVDAIGRSGLRASLEKLSIANNLTLSASKVQEEMNEKGMSHISVVEDKPLPFTY